ncbi:folylpolyglutamate synthase [Aspergillus nomiae NRRL 13137]|uniref:tetrahydrofolate synthase n=1 Tax=Aspergillus nomiae NRRL (strain ATCC 15546 / NRRL 13137 / CBS 260.88 / M93) TaxID=1509407 RepID=A0A0L1IM66_ASPN3|nr:folylpolyglutamate synthase [Aspergillus nomiae NRRL 13137]KNG80664.1 folylpolyglutamate synthase [Aspergillus nomiae NRRL 13137]
MGRHYDDAIELLNRRRASAQPSLSQMRGSDDMTKWLELLSYSQTDLGTLNMIHVAGTNGKGSTCAYISSILQSFGCKVGLYTSPHLLSIRERIRINGKPIEEDAFTKAFYEIWDVLPLEPTVDMDIPRYLQLLTLLSFHVFLKEGVDVAVYEPHMGGEYDATNVVASPVVTAVTRIAEDHVRFLGPTIEDIAWHKAGIFKPGCPAISSPQEQIVAEALMNRANEKKVTLSFVEPDPSLPVIKFQNENCSLATRVATEWISIMMPDSLTNLAGCIDRGIKAFEWPGRYQQIKEGRHSWFLDGAHNDSGLSTAVSWFAEMSKLQRIDIEHARVIIFSHFSDRCGDKLLHAIKECLDRESVEIGHLILTTYNERRNGLTRIGIYDQALTKPGMTG